MGAGALLRAVESLRQRLKKDVVHKGALPRAGNTGYRNEETQRYLNIDIFKIMLLRKRKMRERGFEPLQALSQYVSNFYKHFFLLDLSVLRLTAPAFPHKTI